LHYLVPFASTKHEQLGARTGHFSLGRVSPFRAAATELSCGGGFDPAVSRDRLYGALCDVHSEPRISETPSPCYPIRLAQDCLQISVRSADRLDVEFVHQDV